MRRIISIAVTFATLLLLSRCNVEKNITVVVREQGSGTREAFDRVVTNGEHFLEEKDSEGRKLYNTTVNAIQQTKTGTVISTVMSDVNAIGYISSGAVGDGIKVLSVNGVYPTERAVLEGEYKIQRPFVIMTSSKTELTELAADFLEYLKSENGREPVEKADCIFLSDPVKRANPGDEPVEMIEYEKKEAFPRGEKIVIRGSTSVEKVIMTAARSYAELYGVKAEDIFDVQLEGSSVGKKAASDDNVGNVIGLSSAYVSEEGINSFNLCLDAIAVIVNEENTAVNDLTLAELYGVFSGKTTRFAELNIYE